MGDLKNVDYESLDNAKNAFISAARKTLKFAEKFGFVPDEALGASANIFCLDLKPFLDKNIDRLHLTLLPEGLGTADDARPPDMSHEEAHEFWHNIAIKTISALTNDAAAGGLQTILVSLYLPSARPEKIFNPDFMQGFLSGIIDGCKEVGCVYFSGETPQLIDKINEDAIDIAGALFAISPAGIKPVTSEELQEGCSMVFVESSGPHENGFTVLRKLAKSLSGGYRTKLPSGIEFWRAINAPSRLYTPFIQDILGSGIQPAAVENVTGHGWQKIMRSGKKLSYVVDHMLPVPEVFQFVRDKAGFSEKDMLKIFNYGVGQVVFTREQSDAQKVIELAAKHKLKAILAGRVESSHTRQVVINPLKITLDSDEFKLERS